MLVTMKKREVTEDYAVYDYYAEGSKERHGIAKFNFKNDTYEWVKWDNEFGVDSFYIKALIGMRKMYRQGEFLSSYMVAAG